MSYLNSSTTVSTPVPAENSPDTRAIRTSVNLLVVLIYGGLIVLLVGIFIQRALLRIVPKYVKVHVDAGKFAPKSIKSEIEKRLQQTIHVAFEPQLLSKEDYRYQHLLRAESKSNLEYNYLYRMKAVDDIKKLELALEQTDESLKRHPLKDLHQHLRDVKTHSSGVLKAVRSNQMKALTDAYEHARYRPENFGEKEYQKFKESLDDIMASLETKSKKKRSKKQHSQRNSNNSKNDHAIVSEKEPLLVDTGMRKEQ